jgi:hypothetical protein
MMGVTGSTASGKAWDKKKGLSNRDDGNDGNDMKFGGISHSWRSPGEAFFLRASRTV